MIAIIGLGGAGNQIADEASKLGFHAGAINFSQSDLDSAESVELKLKLVGSEGVGKNRDEAIRLMENNWELATNFIKDNFSHPSIKIIAFAFSTGGGSGSGVSPVLLDILTNEMTDKTFVAIPIIPDKSEVLVNQMNCLSTFEQLSSLNIAVFPIDNEKVKTNYNIVGKNKLYNVANNSVIELLKKIISYTERSSKNGNIDEKDLIQIFKTKGMGTISEVNVSTFKGEVELSKESVAKTIQRSWDSSIFAPIEYNQVVRSGIIFDGQESFMEFLDYDLIFKKFNKGMPIDLFEGNYHDKTNVDVLSILTGLSWCTSRLSEIEYIIEEKRRNAELALDETNNQAYQSNATSLSTKIRTDSKQKKSVLDILSKYKR